LKTINGSHPVVTYQPLIQGSYLFLMGPSIFPRRLFSSRPSRLKGALSLDHVWRRLPHPAPRYKHMALLTRSVKVHPTVSRTLAVPHHHPRHRPHTRHEDPRRDEGLRESRVRASQGCHRRGTFIAPRLPEGHTPSSCLPPTCMMRWDAYNHPSFVVASTGSHPVSAINGQDRVGRYGEVYSRVMKS
jgi:hypothetical protein